MSRGQVQAVPFLTGDLDIGGSGIRFKHGVQFTRTLVLRILERYVRILLGVELLGFGHGFRQRIRGENLKLNGFARNGTAGTRRGS